MAKNLFEHPDLLPKRAKRQKKIGISMAPIGQDRLEQFVKDNYYAPLGKKHGQDIYDHASMRLQQIDAKIQAKVDEEMARYRKITRQKSVDNLMIEYTRGKLTIDRLVEDIHKKAKQIDKESTIVPSCSLDTILEQDGEPSEPYDQE